MKSYVYVLIMFCGFIMMVPCNAVSADEPYTYEMAIENLKSTDMNIRARGTTFFLPGYFNKVTELPIQKSYDILMDVLNNDPVEPIRMNAALALSLFHDDRTIDGILKLSNSFSSVVSSSIYNILGSVGTSKATSILKEKLAVSQGKETAQILIGLGKIKTEDVVDTISPYLKDENIANVDAAIKALGYNGNAKSYLLLLPLAKKNDINMFKAVLEAMARIRSNEAHIFVLNALDDDDPAIRKVASSAINTMDNEDVIDAMIKELKENTDPLVRMSCIRYLSRFPQKVPILIFVETLNDIDPGVRELLVYRIGDRYEPSVYLPILALLKDSNVNVKDAVLTVLALSKEKRAVDSLCGALDNPSPRMRNIIVEGLANIADKRAIRHINSLSNREQDIDVLATILTVFKTFNDKTTPDTVISIIKRIHEQEQKMEKDAADTLKTLTGNEYTGDPKDWK